MMGPWSLLVMIHALLSQLAGAKRFDHSMVDPLMRRSPLDKNFMRFGRSSPAFNEPESSHISSTESETINSDDFLRSARAQDSGFIRFGRGKNDNFLRFGKGKQDNFMRFGRGKQDNFMRFGRGKQDNFMRFGRGKQENFMRFGRGNQYDSTQFERGKNNFIRFGRGKEDNFMRFGRGKENNYMRFGRGKEDNFMRFGRGKEGSYLRFGRGKQDNFMRFGRGSQGNFMRFGRGVDYLAPPFQDPVQLADNSMLGDIKENQGNLMKFKVNSIDSSKNSIPIAMRSSEFNDKFERLLRTRQDNFMRFGKSGGETPSKVISNLDEDKNTPAASFSTYPFSDPFLKGLKSNPNANLGILEKRPSNKDSNFMRFGRNALDTQSTELIPQRLKRSVNENYRNPEYVFPIKLNEDNDDSSLASLVTAKDFPDEDFYTFHLPEDYNSRKKKAVKLDEPITEPLPNEMSFPDHVSIEYLFECPYDFTKIPYPFGKDYYSSDINLSQLFPNCCIECWKTDAKISILLGAFDSRSLPERKQEPDLNSVLIKNRNKRSVNLKHTESDPSNENKTHLDDVSVKLLFSSLPKPKLQSSLISAGLPNVIIGPELSLLPDLNPPSSMLKKNRPSDQNFLRLG